MGSKKHEMEYVGGAVKTALSIVSFLAEERHREDQDTASFLTQSTMAENKSQFFLVNIFRSPKYFPTPPSLVIPRLCFTKSQVPMVFKLRGRWRICRR